MYQEKSRILNNIRASGKYFKLSFSAPKIAQGAGPGQFMLIRTNDCTTPLLRKPFGFHRISPGGRIEVLYEVVGEGTEVLSKKKPGEILDIIGPLGNGFSINHKLSRAEPARRAGEASPKGTINHILVSGGIGVGPVLALAESLKVKKLKSLKVIVLIGAKTKNNILCEEEFKKLGAEIIISTDDGSAGRKCFTTGCLISLLSTVNCQLSTIYACGPNPMLKEISAIAEARNIPCQVLLEEYMACGVGVCLGCPVKTRSGYKLVCKDGPVFDASEIIWDR